MLIDHWGKYTIILLVSGLLLAFLLCLLGLSAIFLVGITTPIQVTTTDDEYNLDGDCSLREAITAANTDTSIDGCRAGWGADTITLMAEATYSLGTLDNETDGPNGLPSITSQITILGYDAVINRDEHSDTPEFRLIHVGREGLLTVRGITLQNGLLSAPGVQGHGGGLLNRGEVTLIQTVIRNNQAQFGGGIANLAGTLTLDQSRLEANHAVFGGGITTKGGRITVIMSLVNRNHAITGGGLRNIDGNITLRESQIEANWAGGAGGIQNQGTIILENSLILGNASGEGGGIRNHHDLRLIKTIVRNNRAKQGGGIQNYGSLSLQDSFVYDNWAAAGGGIFNRGGSVTLKRTKIGANSGGDCDGDIVISHGHNIDSDGSCLGQPQLGDKPKLPLPLGLPEAKAQREWLSMLRPHPSYRSIISIENIRFT